MEDFSFLHVPLSHRLPSSWSATTLVSILLLCWILLHLLYWAFPGGPAWGKHYCHAMATHGRHPPIPGPRGLPFIGSMGLMAGLAHRHLAAAAERSNARKLMAFSLGETRVVVTGDHEVAKEILNSPAFADRPLKELAYSLMFHRAIGFAPYGIYWRTLRRIAATHLFSPRQILSSEQQRRAVAAEMIAALEPPEDGARVAVRDVLKQASLCHMMSLVFGRRYRIGCWKENPELKLLRALVDEGYDLLGKLDWGDHLPVLSLLDLQRIRLRCSTLVPKVKHFVGGIIEEHRAIRREGKGANSAPPSDFVDVLLSLEEPDRLSDDDMVAVLWEMIFRGTDTVAVVVEWVMARMAMHEEAQRRAQRELDEAVGPSRAVAEADVAGLDYLQAVVKEVLRLHPPGPLLSWARRANRDTEAGGWRVPAGTTAMVNMWAITHDGEVWDMPHEFRPERFLGGGGGGGWEEELSVLGSDLRLAPFGAGRRSCPGKVLGMATVTFWVATLLHEYAWRGQVDLSELLRLSCELRSPLTVELRKRRVR